MRLAVTGANGQVEWEVARSLMPVGEVIAFGRRRCDLMQLNSMGRLVASIGPEVIINAAAYTAFDEAK